MDRRTDPYTPGSGHSPGYLASRDQELEEFSVLIDRLAQGLGERSIIYSGLRGGQDGAADRVDALARERG